MTGNERARTVTPRDSSGTSAAGSPSLPALPAGLANDFQAVAILGQGAMGVVVKAMQRDLERIVAIKIPILASPEHQERFVREGRILSKLEHPNLVRVLDAGESDGRPYMVLEFVEGFTLHDVVNSRELDVGEAVGIVLQLLDGLGHTHTQGVLHRDVKTENALITSAGILKLADFGLAWSETEVSGTRTGIIMGTPAYMSPEQADGRPLDARSDLYSATIVLFELLTRRVPFLADDMPTLIHKQLVEPPPPLRELCPKVGRVLEGVIARGLAKNRDARYASASDLSRALVAAVGEQAIEEGNARLIETLAQVGGPPVGAPMGSIPGRFQTVAQGSSAFAKRASRPVRPINPEYRQRTQLTGKTPILKPTVDAPSRRSRVGWAAAAVFCLGASVVGVPLASGMLRLPKRVPAASVTQPVPRLPPRDLASPVDDDMDVSIKYVAMDRIAVDVSTATPQRWWARTQSGESMVDVQPATQHHLELPVPRDGVAGRVTIGVFGARGEEIPRATRQGPAPAHRLLEQVLDALSAPELSRNKERSVFRELIREARRARAETLAATPFHGPQDFARIVNTHAAVARPVAGWLASLLADPRLGRAYFQVRGMLGQFLMTRDAPPDEQRNLLMGLDRLQVADELASYIGRPAPFEAGSARAPAVEFSYSEGEHPPMGVCRSVALKFSPRRDGYCNIVGSDENVGSDYFFATATAVAKSGGKDFGDRWAAPEVRFDETSSDGRTPLAICLDVDALLPQKALVLVPPGADPGIPLRIPPGTRDTRGCCHVVLRGAMVPPRGEWVIRSTNTFTDYDRPSVALLGVHAGRQPE